MRRPWKMPQKLNFNFFLSLLVLVLNINTAHAELEVPRLTGPVVDKASIMSRRYEQSLSAYIRKIYESTGNQLQVLTVPSLDGESIEGYSIRVVDKWKLGSDEKDNGVLFLVAVQDRRMRIEVGQGLEGDLTDLQAGRIIDGVKPYFRNREFDAGINFAIKNIANSIGADPSAAPHVKRRRKKVRWLDLIFLIIFLLLFLRRIFYFRGFGGRSSWGSSRGWSSGGGFSGGGGGWSGGGGGFSGGGSSGSW
jgi:uncharacterized protein